MADSYSTDPAPRFSRRREFDRYVEGTQYQDPMGGTHPAGDPSSGRFNRSSRAAARRIPGTAGFEPKRRGQWTTSGRRTKMPPLPGM